MAVLTRIASAENVHDDILIQILARLPLKSLVRFKCVSKSWRRFISEECIRARQCPSILSGVFSLADANRDPIYGVASGGAFRRSDIMKFFPFSTTSVVVDCCNGLLLYYSYRPAAFYVCNPSAETWVALPKPRKRTLLSVLGFDPYRSPHYKVVCFNGWTKHGCLMEVFSSETGEWAEREVDWGVDTDSMTATVRYFDGRLHILSYPQHVVSVDLVTASCSRIELPEPVKHDGCFGESRGLVHYTNNDGESIRIWGLDGGYWTLKHSVSVGRIVELGSGREGFRGLNFLAFHPEGEVVYIWVAGKILACDLKEMRFDVVCELRGEMEGAYVIQLWMFPCSRFVSECLTTLD